MRNLSQKKGLTDRRKASMARERRILEYRTQDSEEGNFPLIWLLFPDA